MLPLIQPKDIALICTYCYKIILCYLARGRCRHLADLKVMEGQWLKERWDEMQYFSNNTETETACFFSPPRWSHRTSIPCATPQTSTQRHNEIKTVDTGALRRTNTRLNLNSNQETRIKKKNHLMKPVFLILLFFVLHNSGIFLISVNKRSLWFHRFCHHGPSTQWQFEECVSRCPWRSRCWCCFHWNDSWWSLSLCTLLGWCCSLCWFAIEIWDLWENFYRRVFMKKFLEWMVGVIICAHDAWFVAQNAGKKLKLNT